MIAPPPLIYLGPLVVGLLLHRLRPMPVLPRTIARAIGWPLLVGGVAFNGWFVLAMRRARTPIDPRQSARLLVTSGPFQFSRNPSYASMALIYAGVASIVDTVWPVVLLPAVIGLMQRGVIEREERYLERTFSAEYREYKARVRRWL